MTDFPPPLDAARPAESPRWILADGLVEVPAASTASLRREIATLEERTGLRVAIKVEGGRASALIASTPVEIPPSAPADAPDPARSRELLAETLDRLWEEVEDADRLTSTWRLSEFGETTVTETVFAVTPDGPSAVGRPRPLTPDDAEILLRGRERGEGRRTLARMKTWQKATAIVTLVIGFALIVWTGPFLDRWLAPETLAVAAGPLAESLEITVTPEGVDYRVRIARRAGFPTDVAELRRREADATTPKELATWRALGGSRPFFVELLDEEGRRTRVARVPLPELLDPRHSSVEILVRKHRDAAVIRLGHD